MILNDSPIFPFLLGLHYSPNFPIIRFFRLLFCDCSDSPSSTRFSDFPIIRFFRLLFCDFSDSLSSTRFSDFSDYTILPIVILRFFRLYEYYAILRFFRLYDSSDCYSPIFSRFSEFFAILRFFRLYDSSDCCFLIFPILRVLRDSPMFPIIRLYLHKHFVLLYFFYI